MCIWLFCFRISASVVKTDVEMDSVSDDHDKGTVGGLKFSRANPVAISHIILDNKCKALVPASNKTLVL